MVTNTATAAPTVRASRTVRPADSRESAVRSVAPVRRRRSWGYGAAAIGAVVVGGLLSAYLYGAAQQTEQVFVVGTAVDRGQVITAQDLATITVTPGQHIDAYTSTQSGQVIGKVATVALPKGSLLTHEAVAPSLPLPAGQAIVGIALKPSEMPSTPLSAGERVVITPVASQNATVQSGQTGDVSATVVDQPDTDQSSGLVIVNVYVGAGDASDLAGRAAAGLVALYVESGN